MNFIPNVQKNIVVADDNSVMRKVVSALVHKKLPDANIFEAENGSGVLNILKSEKIDWVFLDWHIPECDGYEITKQVKRKTDMNNLKIIMISAETDRHKVTELLSLERVFDYISKPFNHDRIESVIGALLEED